MEASTEQRLSDLEAKLDQISGQLQWLVDAQRPFIELTGELGPIANEIMNTGIDQCAHLEERGYFAFARELKYFVDRLVEDYHPSDLHELADNAANILDTIKSITRPSVMAAVRDAVSAFDESSKLTPVGVFGAYRMIRKDKNVQRGLAFALDVVGRIGRAVARAPRFSRADVRALPSPVHPPVKRVTAPSQSSHHVPSTLSSSSPSSPTSPTNALAVDPNVFIQDSEWSRELGQERANSLGLAQLSDEQWALVESVRAEYKKSGSTPNIRKMTAVSGLTTREIYGLFPKAPGLTVASIACVPKPVGCL